MTTTVINTTTATATKTPISILVVFVSSPPLPALLSLSGVTMRTGTKTASEPRRGPIFEFASSVFKVPSAKEAWTAACSSLA
jgi:hypothetical protein